MIWDKKYAVIVTVIVAAAPYLFNKSLEATDYKPNHDPAGYIIEKFQSHDLLLLGTRHRREPILQSISNLIPGLHDAGVSYIGLEIGSDQQSEIDHYLETGTGLERIEIHPQIDCPAYRKLLKQIRILDKVKQPGVIALDLPKSGYGQIRRDEYMAKSIGGVFRRKPDAMVLVITGNKHVLKKLDWQDHVPRTSSIPTVL